jgi:hypothetical protein
VPRKIAQNDWRRSSRVGSTLPMREVKISCLSLRSRLITTSAMPKNAMAMRDEADAIAQLRLAEGKAHGAGIDIGADKAEQDAQADHGNRLDQRAARHTTAAMSPNTMSEKYSAGLNLRATSARSGAK